MGITPGREISISYNTKFEKERVSFKVKVKGVFISDKNTGDKTIYMHEALFYPKFYDRIPDLKRILHQHLFRQIDASFKSALGNEWELLKEKPQH